MVIPSDIPSLRDLVLGLARRVEVLEAENRALRLENEALRRENAALRQENQELKARLGKNSGNSGKPPSSDGLAKKPAFPRPRGGRPGGKPGHQGGTLEQVAAPDRVEPCRVDRCSCGHAMRGHEHELVERRQVFDLPEPRLEVTEYRLYQSTCGRCGRRHRGAFPQGVAAPAQYGSGVRALCVMLNNGYKIPLRRIRDLFGDLFGHPLNESTAVSANALCHGLLAGSEEAVRGLVAAAPAAHADETGMRVRGRLHWLHAASTAEATYLFAHPKRGREAMWGPDSVLPLLRGWLVHDCWKGYFDFASCRHALCGAHLLRELRALGEQGSRWAPAFGRFLLALLRMPRQDRLRHREAIEALHDRLCARADGLEPPPERRGGRGRRKSTPGRNLLARLVRHKDAVLAFAFHHEVPFTNNLVERDVRPAKLKQKVSGSFRTLRGAQVYARIQGFISTARKQGRNIFRELKNTFDGHNFLSVKCEMT